MAKPASWPESGTVAAPEGATSAVWGACKGSGAKPYLAAVHLDGAGGPAYKCSCPSRKIPCKHVLALLVLWAQEGVHTREEHPEWVGNWLSGRVERRKKAEESTAAPADPKRAAATLKAREEAVESGMRELRLWLDDQIEAGLAEAPKHGYGHWDRMAKRLVDAKAGAAASAVAALPAAIRSAHWPEALLERLSLLHLLVSAHEAGDALDAPTRAAVRARIGIAVKAGEVLSEGERVRDTWRVLGLRDAPTEDGQMTARRVWLHGEKSGRTALFLSFARLQEGPRAPFRAGTEVEAEFAFYPDGHRIVPVADTAARTASPPEGTTVAEALDVCAAALAADPWRDTWPVVLAGAAPAHDGRWYMATADGAALPLDTDAPWTLLAVTGGHPCTVAAEWSPRDGLTPMTVWDREGRVHPL
ncbi:SWIM zinc finger family protein [Nocardiopsis sp. CNT312]|uniref:SWIM zinc finger family protein n=1 Tax=Nocardiopsis sp. CNT312 TaxID=1137268 RepID=UPI00048A7810|nr:SWIM zinc finger family protein [Nocardiopsis sp. CNT312]